MSPVFWRASMTFWRVVFDPRIRVELCVWMVVISLLGLIVHGWAWGLPAAGLFSARMVVSVRRLQGDAP